LNNLRPQLTEILKQAKALPVEDKARLVKELLDSSMTVLFGSGGDVTEIVEQIQGMEKHDISLILNAIAKRIDSSA